MEKVTSSPKFAWKIKPKIGKWFQWQKLLHTIITRPGSKSHSIVQINTMTVHTFHSWCSYRLIFHAQREARIMHDPECNCRMTLKWKLCTTKIVILNPFKQPCPITNYTNSQKSYYDSPIKERGLSIKDSQFWKKLSKREIWLFGF